MSTPGPALTFGSHKTQCEQVFAAAVILPAEQRTAFLDANCTDPTVRREVESLLVFSSGPVLGVTAAIAHASERIAGGDMSGNLIGPYRLTGIIGRGGMGTVYRAVREDSEFQQTVAIKTLRFLGGGPETFERFRRERQILAGLEHPNIARLLDGGAWTPPGSPDAVPYIVMEFVEGEPLGAYCSTQELRIPHRLNLFCQICDTVSHAHRQLVVHRDIKPGNILIMADGTPKLIDFGVAKSLDFDGDLTSTGCLPLTPDYASPEQIRGEPVSTATDVYALGAVLYELMTGRRPHQLASHDPLEIARVICEQEVMPPQMGGDLDVIVLKSLQKDPARRYSSVEQFAEDIRRFQEGLPIIARPDSLAYRARKFAGRHWLGLAAVAAIFLALAVATFIGLWGMRRAAAEAATAKAVTDFLRQDLLSQAAVGAQSEANSKANPNLTVRTALDRAASHIDRQFAAQPLVEAAIRQTIGDAYAQLGLFAEATVQAEQSVKLRSRVLGEEHADTLSAIAGLASEYTQLGKYAQAKPLLEKLVAIRRRLLGRRHHDTLMAMTELGELHSYSGDDGKAEPLLVEALDGLRQTQGSEHRETLTAMSLLGGVYRIEGKYEPAERLLIEASASRNRILGSEHPDSLETAYELAVVYVRRGKPDAAEPHFRYVLDSYRRLLGPDHPFTLTALSGLMGVYAFKNEYAKAQILQEEVVERRRRVLGERHPDTLAALFGIADLQRRQGNLQASEATFTRLAEDRRQVLGESHRDTMSALVGLGRVRFLQGNYRAAEGPLRRAFDLYEKHNPASWHKFYVESMLGACLAGRNGNDESESLSLKGYEGLVQHRGEIPAEHQYLVKEAGERVGNPKKNPPSFVGLYKKDTRR